MILLSIITVKLDVFLAMLYSFSPAMTQTRICLYSSSSISCQININIKSQIGKNVSYLQVLKYRQNWENKGKINDKRSVYFVPARPTWEKSIVPLST